MVVTGINSRNVDAIDPSNRAGKASTGGALEAISLI
jgi:hypothetical protein